MKVYNTVLNITEDFTDEILAYFENGGRIHRREAGGSVKALRLVMDDVPYMQIINEYSEKEWNELILAQKVSRIKKPTPLPVEKPIFVEPPPTIDNPPWE